MVHTSDHSPCTFSNPRNRNCRKPRACLICPITGSTIPFKYGSGERLFGVVKRMQLEGIVAKHKDSVYSSGRSRFWQKIKTTAGKTEMQKRLETWR